MQIFSSLQLACSSKGRMKRWPSPLHPCRSPDHNTLSEKVPTVKRWPAHLSAGGCWEHTSFYSSMPFRSQVLYYAILSPDRNLFCEWETEAQRDGTFLYTLIQLGKWQLGWAPGTQSLAHALFTTCPYDGFNCPFRVPSSFAFSKKKGERTLLKPLGEVTAASKGGNREEWTEEERACCTYWVFSMAGYTFHMYFLG